MLKAGRVSQSNQHAQDKHAYGRIERQGKRRKHAAKQDGRMLKAAGAGETLLQSIVVVGCDPKLVPTEAECLASELASRTAAR